MAHCWAWSCWVELSVVLGIPVNDDPFAWATDSGWCYWAGSAVSPG